MATNLAALFHSLDYGPAPEASAEAQAWLDRHGRKFGHFVNGAWRPGRKYFDSVNPATKKKLADVALGSKEDVDAAVKAARKAQPGWAALGGFGRAKYLYALARHIQKHTRLLAVLETLDNGKTIRETRDIDIPLVARHFLYHAGWAQLLESELKDMEPVGVCGQIIPWNFPLLMLAWKIAPALAAGNTVILKPAEFTSLTALAFAEICQAAELPKGVVNIVTGEGETGAAIVDHPGIDKIAFTGSTEVGRLIRRATAGTGKKLSLELGGKSPFIVFDDADIDSAVEGVVDAIWFNQGQVCCAGSRLLLQEGIAERMIAKLRARMETLRIGNPLDKAVDIGAIVAAVQWQRIDALVKQGVSEGAAIWQPSWSCPTEGWFYPPTLLTDVQPASTVMQVEIFGPVLAAMTFRTPAEAVEIANNTPYGLAASLWTENINLALDMAPKIKAGVVWVNCTNQFDASVGFGGYRESGFGREGGIEGMWEYLKPNWEKTQAALPAKKRKKPLIGPGGAGDGAEIVSIDRTSKLFIGGRQVRPDGGYSRTILDPQGKRMGEAGEGNRKDIRDAVEAALAQRGWASLSGHGRAQILYYLGENLAERRDEFAALLARMGGAPARQAKSEVEKSLERCFAYAAWADKYDGLVHNPPLRGVALAMNEPMGIVGIACPDEAPLLGFMSLALPAIAMGNRVVAVPSPLAPLAATALYQVIETSDVPAGVINIVTGDREELACVLADHQAVDALWYFGSRDGGADIERRAAENLKRTFTNRGRAFDWHDNRQSEGRHFLRQATQVKNIWIPYGE
ncbi:MAG TPA: aldehyde dehydrogenase family protein [Dongiaceae bacterium]|nr:aldehyde dehydrogenase family protein [Dongiaceae bacterium]